MKKIICLLLIAISYQPTSSPRPVQDGFILITSLYNETRSERAEEYLHCLKKNLAHPLIKKIHIIYDTARDTENNEFFASISSNPVTITKQSDRPDFAQCFAMAQELYPNENIMIANADIFFNITLHHLLGVDLEKKFFALTRWNVQANGSLSFFRRVDSQDVWIFQTPMLPFEKADFKLGTVGCDNYIAFQARKAGYAVSNPCLTIQTCHMHLSDLRNYTIGGARKGDILTLPWKKLSDT